MLWENIIQELLAVGVELHDFQRIEYLESAIGSEHFAGDFSDPIKVAKWMLKEAASLEARLMPIKAKTTAPQTVTVCSKV